MYRIDNATAATALPAPASTGPRPNGYFTKGNPSTGTPATIVDDDWANAVQEEICNVIEGAGLTLSKTDNKQLYNAITANLNNRYPLICSRATLRDDVTHQGIIPTKIVFNNVTQNIGDRYDPIEGRFIAPFRGVYRVFCALCVRTPAGTTVGANNALYLNGQLISSDAIEAFGAEPTIDLFDELILNENDYLEIFSSSTTAENIKVLANNRTRFIVTLVRKL